MWKFYAILSAVFAALTAILAKLGVKGIDSNLATTIRTFVILLLTLSIVTFTGSLKNIGSLTRTNIVFLCLSGLATGISWLFYFKALQTGDVSKVAPIDKLSVAFAIILSFIILKEKITVQTIIGGLLIVAGSIVLIL